MKRPSMWLSLVFLFFFGLAARQSTAQSSKTEVRTVTRVEKDGSRKTGREPVRVEVKRGPGKGLGSGAAGGVQDGRMESARNRVQRATLPVNPYPSGPPATTINSRNFGSAVVGGQPTTITLTFDITGYTGTGVSIAIAQGSNFAALSVSCQGNTCSVPVAFKPLYPGPLLDGITVTDSNGNLLGKTFLYGNGTAGQFGYDLGNVTVYENYVGNPAGVAIGPDENYYFADPVAAQVIMFKRDLSGSTILPLDIGLPAGLAVDGAGTVYVLDQVSDLLISYTKAKGQVTIPTTPLSSPTGLAVDGAGSLYVTDTKNNRIIKVDNQGHETTLASGLNAPQGIAVDGAGHIFFADAGNNGEIIEIVSSDGPTKTIGSNLLPSVATGQMQMQQMQGVAVDAGGRVYYTTTVAYGTISPAFAENVTYGSGTDGPSGVAVDRNGDVLLTQTGDGNFQITDRSASNFILETTVGDSISGTLTASNTGNSALTFSGLEVTGDVFTIDSSSVCNAQTVLQAGQTCDVTVDFSPTEDFSYQEMLTASSDSLNKPGTTDPFTLYGTGDALPTSTALSVNMNSGNAGQTFTFTATVAVQQETSEPPPTGTVTFQDGTDSFTVLGTVDLANGSTTAVFSTTTLAVGIHHISAAYGGDAVYGPSTSPSQTVTVTLGPTTTALSRSAASIPAGQTETLTAAVAGGTAPVETGNVTFSDQNGVLGTVVVTATSTGSSASLALTNLAIGSHTVTAMYSGDIHYAASTSSAQTVVVTAGVTTTTLTTSAASLTAGQAETLTAAVAGGTSPVETGNVTFSDQNGVLGTVVITATSTGSTAALTLSNLAVGSHTITAMYSGDIHYAASTSGAQTVVVNAAAATTATTLTAVPAVVTYEKPITLTAGVQRPGAGAVTVGQVIFCDAAAARCDAVFNLATAQLNANGSAVARLSPGGVGSHSYKAIFLGRTGFAKSTSGAATVTVTGLYPTTTTIASSGVPGNYGLTGTVVGTGTRTLAPTGTVTFSNFSSPRSPALGMGTLGAGTLGFTAVQPSGSPVKVGSQPYGVATGDFNGDGFADVVMENYTGNNVSVLLGNGDGTFKPQVTYAVGSLPERVLVADFNGDGYADLVVANTGSGTISILLGNGDGTFKAQVTYAASSPVGLGVMDLNHDGIADIVAGDYYSNTVSVLLGNGDGTFQRAVTYATGSTPQTLAEGDFNGDGNVDLAVGNEGSATVGIFLGNGDGTFKAQVTYAVGAQPQGVQVGDFNGDGIEDLAVVNQGPGTVSVLLGTGDGTFQPQVSYAVGVQPVGLVVADFNGDGLQDIAVNNTGQASLTEGILLGNGDGTFQAQLTYKTGNFPYGSAVGDFNGDGYPDLAIATFSDGTATILLSEATETATASISGVNVSGTPGTYQVIGMYSGDSNFSSSSSTTIPLSGNSATTATQLTIAPTAPSYGQSVLFSVSVAATSQTTPVPTGTVTLRNLIPNSANLGTITLDGTGKGSLSTSTLAVGNYTVSAMYNGDANYAASSSAQQMLVVSPGVTTTSLSASAANITAGQTETLTAVVSGGTNPPETGSVVFSDQNGVLGTVPVTATTSGSSAVLALTTLAAGSHQITARYSGDTNYAASTSAAQTVTVAATTTTPTLNAQNFGNATIGAAPVVMTLTYPAPGATTTVKASVAQGLYFAVQSSGCVSTQCTVTVAFTPLFPGLLEDAVTLTDASGRLLGKTFVYGTGIGPQFAFELGLPTSYPNFNFNPAGVAIGPDENYYFADPIAQQVTKFSRDLATSTVLPLNNLGLPSGIAVDGAGTVYVLDQTNDAVVSYNAAGVQASVKTTQLASPTGLAVDGAGTLYITDTGNNRIIKVDIQGRETTLETGLNSVQGIAIDAAGDVFFADQGNNGEIQELVASTGQTVQVRKNLAQDSPGAPVGVLQAVAVDAGGSLYYTTSTFFGVLLSSGSAGADVSGGVPTGVAVDRNGNLVATLTGNGAFSIYNVSTEQFGLETAAGSLATGNIFIQNTGNSPLSLSNVGVAGTGFMLDPGTVSGFNKCLPKTSVPSAQVCLATVDFTPPSSGTFPGTFTALSNSLNQVGSTNTSTINGIGDLLASTTGLTASANAVSAGQSVTFTATIASTNATTEPGPTGSVQFMDGTALLATVNVSGGQAVYTTTSLGVGSHTIIAVYSGDTIYRTSTSPMQSVSVSTGATSTALTVSAASLSSGRSETLTATIRGGASPAETGTVTFSDQNGVLGTAAVSATGTGGTASLTLTSLSIGTHQITARYGGDANYSSSSSAAQTVAVFSGTTGTSLSVSAATLSTLQTETLTATIGGGVSPAETGTVTFSDQNGVLGTMPLAATSTGGTATLALNNLSVGTHQITARYGGDANYAASSSAVQTVTVFSSTTGTSLSVSAATLSAIQPETLTAAVGGGASPAETGTVTFSDQNGVLGTVPLTATGTGGTAVLTLTSLSVGTHQITARYGGDANYSSSSSAAQTVTVSLATQTITFPAIPGHILGDAPFGLTATASSGLAVTYSVVSGAATVSGSQVTLTGLGTVTIQASQAGNASYAAATPVSQSFTVVPPAPTLSSISPASGYMSAVTAITLTGTNFTANDTVLLNGTAVTPTFVNATTLSVTPPASFFATPGTETIAVHDPVGNTTTAAVNFIVSALPGITFAGPATASSGQQPSLTFQLTPFPTALTGTLTLTFVPANATLPDDPNVGFSTGGRLINFAIPANSTSTPPVLVAVGTVAGTVTVTLVVRANGVNVTAASVTPVVITVLPAVPNAMSAALTRNGNSLSVTTIGFSNTREVAKAIFHFTPVPGATLQNPDLTLDVTTNFATWFSSAGSAQYGSAFAYTQLFNLDQDAGVVQNVTVTLVNTVGNSAGASTP